MDTKIKCIAVDDETKALNTISGFCNWIPELDLVACCSSPFEATEVLKSGDIQLMFLDLNMPKMDGISFLRVLQNPPLTVLMTGYPEFLVGIEDFELNPVDILMKPIPMKRFRAAAMRALNLIYEQQQAVKDAAEDYPDYTYFNVGKQYVKIDHEDISYLEAMDYLVRIHLGGGKVVTISKTSLTKIEEGQLLPTHGADAPFMRVHRSFIISMDKIQMIYKQGGGVVISGREIPVGKTYRAKFKKRMEREM